MYSQGVVGDPDDPRLLDEGVVIAYCDSPTITVRHDDGSQKSWSVTLPVELVASDPQLPTLAGAVIRCRVAGQSRSAVAELRECGLNGRSLGWFSTDGAEIRQGQITRVLAVLDPGTPEAGDR